MTLRVGEGRRGITLPASGAGRGSCPSSHGAGHGKVYRRGSLKPKTIKELMLFMCTIKFDMESEQLFMMDEYLTTQETQTVKEEKDT
jgi:hypothetical protein